MRLATLAVLSLSVLLVSAQTSTTDASSTSELLAEIAKLPTCVVRTTIENRNHRTQLTAISDHLHSKGSARNAMLSQRSCVPM
jgi:4-hydroxy-3-methylbut-2-en-1-yl diphosphate synthase IspG/GcpE